MPKIPTDREKPAKTESPARHYDRPAEVLKDRSLTKDEKGKALETWQVDAEALQRAESEGMGGGEPSRMTDVTDAKKALDDKPKKAGSPA